MKPKTCVKCGAPLKGNKCEYCHTEYDEDIVVEKKRTNGKEREEGNTVVYDVAIAITWFLFVWGLVRIVRLLI